VAEAEQHSRSRKEQTESFDVFVSTSPLEGKYPHGKHSEPRKESGCRASESRKRVSWILQQARRLELVAARRALQTATEQCPTYYTSEKISRWQCLRSIRAKFGMQGFGCPDAALCVAPAHLPPLRSLVPLRNACQVLGMPSPSGSAVMLPSPSLTHVPICLDASLVAFKSCPCSTVKPSQVARLVPK
jgi:hypothetical protein